MIKRFLMLVALIALLACGGNGGGGTAALPEYAIVIHGGAGLSSGSLPPDEEAAYRQALARALEAGVDELRGGGTSLDAVERVIRIMEDDPLFNAGKGAVFDHAGINELDASIMDGSTLDCGAVAAVRTVKNPISLARLVMERSEHILLVSDGAEQFAAEVGVELVPPSYFYTEKRWKSLQRAIGSGGGTVGVAALDCHGNLAAGTSTGGLTDKMYGRVGDSPIIGAGTYADNRTCAVSCTGKGEEFIRRSVAFQVSALMEHAGLSLQQAAEQIIHQQLKAGDGGLIGVSADGDIAMIFNTGGMFRGAADSRGRFEIAIWP